MGVTWTDQMLDDLRLMWAEGVATKEMGQRLGVTKNAVVGKSHRLRLQPRPSAIRNKDDIYTSARDELILDAGNRGNTIKSLMPALNALPGRLISYTQAQYRQRVLRANEWVPPPRYAPPVAKVKPVPTPKPARAKTASTTAQKAAYVAVSAKAKSAPAAVVQTSPKAAPKSVPVFYKPLRPRACCWPIGEPGKPGFRFCCETSISTKPYCEEHAKLAYIRVKNALRDAA